MNSDVTRSTHIEIANISFNHEQEDSDEISSEHSVGKLEYLALTIKFLSSLVGRMCLLQA